MHRTALTTIAITVAALTSVAGNTAAAAPTHHEPLHHLFVNDLSASSATMLEAEMHRHGDQLQLNRLIVSPSRAE